MQASHAVLEASRQAVLVTADHPSLVLCVVESEGDLLELAARLECQGVALVVFREPDLDHQATALATQAVPRNRRKLFRSLPLLTFQEHTR